MSTKVCGNPAALRYTWAGREELAAILRESWTVPSERDGAK